MEIDFFVSGRILQEGEMCRIDVTYQPIQLLQVQKIQHALSMYVLLVYVSINQDRPDTLIQLNLLLVRK